MCKTLGALLDAVQVVRDITKSAGTIPSHPAAVNQHDDVTTYH